MEKTVEKIKCLIIGSGKEAYLSVIYAAIAKMNPVFYPFKDETCLVNNIQESDFLNYNKGILESQIIIQLQNEAKRFDAQIRDGLVTKVNFSDDVRKVWINNNIELHCDTVIISTALSPKYLELPSEQYYLKKGIGVSTCVVCHGFFYRNQEVVIMGTGDSACEEALYLSLLCKKVTLLVKSIRIRASKNLIRRIRKAENITLLKYHEILEVLGDGEVVTGVKARNKITMKIFDIPATGFFLSMGHEPNTTIFKEYLALDKNGYIVTISSSSKTNINGVFVARGTIDHVCCKSITPKNTGSIAVIDAERYLAKKG
ncbi:thioredoxin-disulfide reductase [Flavobacterium rhamnosiphilum]|uniref:Thioredoxin-disulfide reductase n=1 Tax=Flavobacterium rhamnosiphilum TaxID=2541724 RepID=A0A4R5F5A6_9FLAO|nr:NAD(P)/FAD-dependent oxidoreductase [Flavobacterium rhamnosiphilum]TDE42945.1 thioredoxin-disulfide reductase [Flavobacterium rhamnosiphilum]